MGSEGVPLSLSGRSLGDSSVPSKSLLKVTLVSFLFGAPLKLIKVSNALVESFRRAILNKFEDKIDL